MDIKKIGKFIAENRKKKNLTQEQLAEKLGVTSKTISRWENGNYMPDISLLKPLSTELDISLNDLLSGEKVEKEKYQDKLEENILNTIDYSNKKVIEKNNKMGVLFIIFGILCSFTAMTVFPSDSSWGGAYSVLGAILVLFGVCKVTSKMKYSKRLLYCIASFVLMIVMLVVIDYLGVLSIHQPPRFYKNKVTTDNVIYYDTPFYDVIKRRNPNKENEQYEVVRNQKYNIDKIQEYAK